ncbi:MAG: 30S ribosomal protein S2 [Parcubacteria group bacterium]|nr:30S ribosomal protein S2 [Parcubacteria group bacterium]MBI2618207.1 30S ribosomal protein S2 [Candidatus Kaiserbacteria bacterium]
MDTGIKMSGSGTIQRMFEAGAHFAYSKARRHPTAQPYIFGVKDKVEIFDLEKTEKLLQEAIEFIISLAKEGKQVLFVTGKNEARDMVKNTALSLDMPYVAGRWIGGTLTNFDEIKKRIARLETLIGEREKGELARKYTKREQLLLGREIASLEAAFGGLTPMKELPAALFVIDTKREHIPVEEAKKRNIPVIALMNSDCDVGSAEYPIFANDAGTQSIGFFTHALADAYKKHKAVPRAALEKKDETEK